MSALTPYLAVAIFPFAFIFGFSLNPVTFDWTRRHGFKPMPDDIFDKAATFSRYANFLGDALIVGLVAWLAHWGSISSERLGLDIRNWKFNIALGVAAAGTLIALQSQMSRHVPLGTSSPFVVQVRKGSIFLWIITLIVGAFSEEIWIAFCLVAFRAAGYSVLFSIAVTAAVFGVVHYGYRFGGVIAVSLKAIASASLFVWSGSLIPMFLFHLIGNFGSLYRARHR